MNEQAYILIVDDEKDICEILSFNLQQEGYITETAFSAEEAIKKLDKPYDLLLLDIMMGEMSGFALAKRLKKNPQTASLPIIFLTARNTENDLLTGFNLGADDYISKPFRLREVIARIQAVLKRTTHSDNNQTIVYESLTMDLDRKTVSIDGKTVDFTRTEFLLLSTLLKRKGHVFSREELIEHVWPQDSIVSDRTVDVNINRMRKKLGRYATNVITRTGFGYSFMP